MERAEEWLKWMTWMYDNEIELRNWAKNKIDFLVFLKDDLTQKKMEELWSKVKIAESKEEYCKKIEQIYKRERSLTLEDWGGMKDFSDSLNPIHLGYDKKTDIEIFDIAISNIPSDELFTNEFKDRLHTVNRAIIHIRSHMKSQLIPLYAPYKKLLSREAQDLFDPIEEDVLDKNEVEVDKNEVEVDKNEVR